MKTLLLMRHAKSSWDHEGLSDHERPLNKRGLRDAPRIGTLLKQEGLTPDLIIASTAVRARTTAGLVAEACGYDGDAVLDDSLYGGDAADYLAAARNAADAEDCVLLIAHNPVMEDAVHLLGSDWESMPTAALAVIELPLDAWAELGPDTRGSIQQVWRPKELDG